MAQTKLKLEFKTSWWLTPLIKTMCAISLTGIRFKPSFILWLMQKGTHVVTVEA